MKVVVLYTVEMVDGKLKEVEKREKEEVVTCGVCVGVVDKLVFAGATGTTENTEKHFNLNYLHMVMHYLTFYYC